MQTRALVLGRPLFVGRVLVVRHPGIFNPFPGNREIEGSC